MPKLIDAADLCSRLDCMMSESSDAVSLSAIVALAVVKGALIPDLPDASEPLRARIKELEGLAEDFLNQVHFLRAAGKSLAETDPKWARHAGDYYQQTLTNLAQKAKGGQDA